MKNHDIQILAWHILESLVDNQPFKLPDLDSLSALTSICLISTQLRCCAVFLKAKTKILEGKMLGNDAIQESWWTYL